MKVTNKLQAVSGMCVPVMLLMLLCTSAVLVQAQTPKPGDGLKQYEVWIGDWKYQAESKDTPLGPAGKSVGTQTVRWTLNGKFLEFSWRENGPLGDIGAFELDWYDATTKSYPYQGFMDNGDMYTATGTVHGNVWKNSGTQTHNGKAYKFRGEITLSADGSSTSWKNEMSPDGKKWIPWNEGKATKTTGQNAAVEQEIMRLERIWAETSVKKDVAALAALLADDVTSGNAEGKWLTKAQLLEDLKSGEYAATSAVNEDMKVKVFGDIAVVTGRCTETSKYKGLDSSGQYIWTDTWQKRPGGWLCVATHGSKVGTKIGQ